MKSHYDFSNGRKNPYAEKLKKEGYTVSIHYSAQDIAEMSREEESAPVFDEIAAFEEYRASKKALNSKNFK